MDAHRNFAYSKVATAPTPATSGITLVVDPAGGALFPLPPFNAVVWPDTVIPLASNAEIVRVTNIAGDTFTITRAQEGTTARAIAVGYQISAAITAKLLTDVEAALSPPGTIIEYAGFVEPAGGAWLMADGAAVDRTAYAALFEGVSTVQSGTLTSGATAVTGLADTSQLYVGVPVEGQGVPAGATVAAITSATAVTLSAAASVSGVRSLRFLPWGRGDGVATFNKPDRRGRQAIGRGTHADNSGLGMTEGLAVGSRTQKHAHSHTLTLPNHAHAHALTLPSHAHGISDPGHAHSVYDPGHGHSAGASVSDPGHGHGYAGDHTHGAAQDSFATSWGNVAALGAGGSNRILVSGSGGMTTAGGHSHNNSGTGISVGVSVNGAGTGIGIYGNGTGITVGNPTTTPAIGGTIGNPSTLPAIAGAVGTGGTTDTGAFVVVNHLVKT